MKRVSLISNRGGFSLVEAIIAVAVFAIIVSYVATGLVRSHKYIINSGNQYRATALAEEGLEAARNIRDNAFANLTDTTTHGISSSGTAYSFSGSQDTQDIFTRKIYVSTIDSTTKEIKSEIKWTDSGGSQNISLSERLTNWRKTKATASISRWPFDENTACVAHDVVGPNDAALMPATCPTGSATWSTNPKRVGTSALTFDGSNDYVQAPDSNSLDLTTSGTLMAWIYPTKNNTTAGIINKGSAAASLAYYLNVNNKNNLIAGVIKTGGANGTPVTVATANNVLTLNAWNHIAMTWDATTLKVYVNGVLSNTTNTTALVARVTAGTLQIGAIYPTTSRFTGTIDEVSIYDVALSATEISTIFASQ